MVSASAIAKNSIDCKCIFTTRGIMPYFLESRTREPSHQMDETDSIRCDGPWGTVLECSNMNDNCSGEDAIGVHIGWHGGEPFANSQIEVLPQDLREVEFGIRGR